MKMSHDSAGNKVAVEVNEDGVLSDYGGLLRNGVRGKYAGKITHINGRPIPPSPTVQRLVNFSPDIAAAFPTDEAINTALRSLMASAQTEEAATL